MYKVPDIYLNYYENYIDRDIREFKLECDIAEEVDIASIMIEHDLLKGADSYTIGNLAAAKLTMKVSSNVNVYESQEINLTVKLKAQDVYGTEIWIPVPLGRFYVFTVTSTKLSKTIVAYDDLYKIPLERTYVSKLKYPATTHEILSELCTTLDIGFNTDNIPEEVVNRPVLVTETILNENGKYEVIESDSDQVGLGMKRGQILMYLASFLGGNFIVDADHNLKLIKYPESVTKSYDFSKYEQPTQSVATCSINRIDCTIHKDAVISVGSTDEDKMIEFDNAFMDRNRLLDILYELEAVEYNQFLVRLKGDPRLQLGDLIETYEIDSEGRIVNRHAAPILRMKFSYTGGCTNEIESPCNAITERTINYKGTITARLDSLENTVTSSQTEIDRINSSLDTLKTFKDNVDDMNILIQSMATEVTTSNLNKHNLLYEQVLASDISFETKYQAVYNNRFL